MVKSKRITPLQIERTKAKGTDVWLSDDEGARGGGRLVVRISTSGSKIFYFRYSINGVRQQIPIGLFSLTTAASRFTLEQAREIFRQYSALHRSPESRDVAAHLRRIEEQRLAAIADAKEQEHQLSIARQQESLLSLRKLCEWYIKHLENGKKISARDVRSVFGCYIFGTEWEHVSAKSFTARQATTLLRTIDEAGKGRTAARVRSCLHSAYALALKSALDPTAPAELIVFGIEVNPIASTAALSQFSKARDRALSPAELGAVWRKLRDFPEPVPLPIHALRLSLLLGGQRALQLLRVKSVDDVNLTDRTITLFDGKGRRQNPRAHVLPLSEEALREVAPLLSRSLMLESPWLFASVKGPMGAEAMSVRIHDLSQEMLTNKTVQKPFQFSDLRRTAETLLASLGISKDIRAQIQSHGLSGVQTRHYDRYEYMNEKAAALEAWQEFMNAQADGIPMKSNVKQMLRA